MPTLDIRPVRCLFHPLLLGLFGLFFFQPAWAQRDRVQLEDFSTFLSGKRAFVRFVISAGNTCDGIRIWRASASGSFEVIHDIPGICGSESEAQLYVIEDVAPLYNQSAQYRLSFGDLGFSDTLRSFFVQTGPQSYWLQQLSGSWVLFVENPENKEITLQLADASGRSLLQRVFRGESQSLPIQRLPAGILFFQLSDEKRGVFATGRWWNPDVE